MSVAHSALGASSAKRWMACPGSVAKCAALPPPPESPYAREGTNAHAWAEFCLANGDEDCTAYIGCEPPSAELAQFPPLSKEMAEAVNVYLEHVFSILRPEDSLFVEQRVFLDFIAEGMFGTNDCAILKPGGVLHVIDYKHGVGVSVDAEDNPQLKYYALGALHKVKDWPNGSRVTKVITTIVQPRAPGEPIRTFEYHALDLWEWADDLREAAVRTREPNAPLVAGNHCVFCPAKGICDTFRQRAHAVATDGMGVVTKPETLTPADLAARLDEAYLLRAWCNAAIEYVEGEALAGRMLPGFKFVQGIGRRIWALPDDEIVAAVKERTRFDISETVCLSPAQAEKHIGRTKFNEACADLVTKKFNRPSLVRESDKRPAISLDEVRKAAATRGMEVIE